MDAAEATTDTAEDGIPHQLEDPVQDDVTGDVNMADPMAYIEGGASMDFDDADLAAIDMSGLEQMIDGAQVDIGINPGALLGPPADAVGGGLLSAYNEAGSADEEDGEDGEDEDGDAEADDDGDAATADMEVDDAEGDGDDDDHEELAAEEVEAEDDSDSDASSHHETSKAAGSTGVEYFYPAPMLDYAEVPEREKRFRAGRFLPCQVSGCGCTSMQPPPGAVIHVSVGEPVDPAIISASRNMTEEGWWRTCGVCGHGWEGTGHVFPDSVDASERARRGRVMSRIEELLAVRLMLFILFTDSKCTYDLTSRTKSYWRIFPRQSYRLANLYTNNSSPFSAPQAVNVPRLLYLLLSTLQILATWTPPARQTWTSKTWISSCRETKANDPANDDERPSKAPLSLKQMELHTARNPEARQAGKIGCRGRSCAVPED